MTQKTVHKNQLLIFTSGKKFVTPPLAGGFVKKMKQSLKLLFECEGVPAQVPVLFICIYTSFHQLLVSLFGSL